jgi:hypothetical protein
VAQAGQEELLLGLVAAGKVVQVPVPLFAPGRAAGALPVQVLCFYLLPAVAAAAEAHLQKQQLL